MRHRLPIAPPRTPPLPYPPYLLLVNSLKLRMIGRSLPAQAQFHQIPRDPQDPGLPERLFRNLSQRDALNVLTLDKHCYQVVFGGMTGKAVRNPNRVLGMAGVCSGIGNICEMIGPFECLVCKEQLCCQAQHHTIFRCLPTKLRAFLCKTAMPAESTFLTSSAACPRVPSTRTAWYKVECISASAQPGEIPCRRNAAYNNCIYEDVEPEIELNNRIREEEHLAKEVQELHRAIGWVPLAALRERRKGLWMIERGGLSWLEDSFMFEKF
ncbi:hypothetical protein RUND412_005741 [Rhizina undulata]